MNSLRIGSEIIRILVAVLIAFSICIAQGAESPALTTPTQLRYFQGLRERRLYELIEMLCQREIKRENLSVEEQLFYRIELAKTYAAHAQAVPLEQARELWEQAFETLQIQENQDVALTSLLELERSLLRAHQAEQIFFIAVAEPGNETLATHFFQTAKLANSELEASSQTVYQFLKRPNQSRAANAITAARKIRMTASRKTEIEVLRARLYRQLAEIKQTDIPERTAAIQQAIAIAKPIARKTTNGFWEQSAKLILLSAARLEKDKATFTGLYQALNQPTTDLSIRQQATAEFTRYLLMENKDSKATQMLMEYAREVAPLSPELIGLQLQAMLKMAAAVRQAGDKNLANQLDKEVQLRLTKLEKQGGSYHAWLVRKMNQQQNLEKRFGSQISPKLLQAREAVRQKNGKVAQSNYDAAILLAMQESRGEILMELSQEAAKVDFQFRDFKHAAQQLKAVWEASPHYPKMESIHLLWVYALGRDYGTAPTREKLAAYLHSLHDHRVRYANKKTQPEATWLLAEMQFASKKIPQAIDLYQTIPQTHAKHLAAQLRTGQCFLNIIQQNRDLKQPVLLWQKRAVEYATTVEEIWNSQPIHSPQQAELFLMTTQIFLDTQARKPDELQQQISRILVATQSALKNNRLTVASQKEWHQTYQSALAIQGILFVAQGKVDAARQLLTARQSVSSLAQDKLFLARQLSAAQRKSPRDRMIVSELLLLISEPIKSGTSAFQKLTKLQKIELRELRAEAFVDSGQLSKAIALYEQLVAQSPAKQKYLFRLSALFDECNNNACWKKSAALWKNRVGKEKQGTEAWLEARYQLARVSILLGQIEDAKKIVQVTLLLYPNRCSKQLQSRYQILAAKLQLSP